MTDSPFLHWPEARYTQGEARQRRERERLQARRAVRTLLCLTWALTLGMLATGIWALVTFP